MADAGTATDRLTRRLGLKIGLARAALWIERTWVAAAPATGVAALFLALSAFGFWSLLHPALHALLLIAFVAGLVWAIRLGFRDYRVVHRDEALGRLERDSGLRHAPLRSLDDDLAGEPTDPATRALWAAHRERLRTTLATVRVTPPRSALPRLDPWAVRALLGLLVVVGLVEADDRLGDRLRAAFLPGFATAAPLPDPTAELWITPPAYTRLAPFQALAVANADGSPPAPVQVPAGSEALVQLHHLQPEEAVGGLTLGEAGSAFARLGAGSAEARLAVDASGRLVASDGRGSEIAGWDVTALADAAPTVAFKETPKPTHRGVLQIGWDALDDYGIAEVGVVLLAPGAEDGERFRLSRPADQPKRTQSSAYLDLTPNPLAGLPVELILEAKDALGQVGRSQRVSLTLPERPFNDPLARLVIEARRQLATNPEDREAVADMLSRLAESPQATERGATPPLALESAAARLRQMQPEDDLREVQDQLWETALLLEEGELSLAESQMRKADQALRDALERDAEQEELERLLDELQQAMNQYLDEMMRKAMEEAQNAPRQQQRLQQEQAESVRRQDLQQMLDQAREMLRNGQREALEQMLAQLRDTLENLQAQVQQEPSAEEQAIGQLQDLIQRQQKLMDEAFRMEQQGENGEQGQEPGEQGDQGQQAQGQQGQGQQGQGQQGGQGQRGQGRSPGQMAGDQDQLRRDLGQLMQDLAETGLQLPRSLGQAEFEMRGARDNLQQGSPGPASEQQGQAVDLMQQAGRGLMEQMQQMMGERPGEQGNQQAQGRPQQGRDPLGRSEANDGGADLDNVDVPDEAALGRARDVLEELFRRSAQPDRSQQERDYYNRLLDRSEVRLRVLRRPSPNHDARPEDAAIDMLVLHYTGMRSADEALARLRDPQAAVSAHWLVDEDGTVAALVPERRRAWHAGASHWAGRRRLNDCSIGIEIVNPGHEWGYRPFPDVQMVAVIELCRRVLRRWRIPSERVLAHSDIAPLRKEDPGELFDWARLAGSGIGMWPIDGVAPVDDGPATDAALRRLGYGLAGDGSDRAFVIRAFQRHWRQDRVDGIADRETRARLAGLLARAAELAGANAHL